MSTTNLTNTQLIFNDGAGAVNTLSIPANVSDKYVLGSNDGVTFEPKLVNKLDSKVALDFRWIYEYDFAASSPGRNIVNVQTGIKTYPLSFTTTNAKVYDPTIINSNFTFTPLANSINYNGPAMRVQFELIINACRVTNGSRVFEIGIDINGTTQNKFTVVDGLERIRTTNNSFITAPILLTGYLELPDNVSTDITPYIIGLSTNGNICILNQSFTLY